MRCGLHRTKLQEVKRQFRKIVLINRHSSNLQLVKSKSLIVVCLKLMLVKVTPSTRYRHQLEILLSVSGR